MPSPSFTSPSQPLHVAIIGAGMGGVALAARLAHAGFRVTVYEKNNFSGGRCSVIEKNGYRFDQGPSLYLMPTIFQTTFTDVDENINDFIRLVRCDPNYRIHFHDGDTIELSSDLVVMRRELERIEPNSFGQYLALQRKSQFHYDLSVSHVLSRTFSKFVDMLTVVNVKLVQLLHIHISIYRWVARYFRSDKLRQAFTFQTMYLGMSPYDAPATYSLLQFTEFAEGIWYPLGGFHSVIVALENIAKKHGARFYYNTTVTQIRTSPTNPSRVIGVTLNDESNVDYDIVVCNADLVWAYTNLLPHSSYTKRLESLEHTCSSFSFYWGLNTTVPELLVHNVFLAEKFRESFDDIFVRSSLPEEPSFYIHVPSRIDPTAAPPGKDTITVLVPTGILVKGQLDKNEINKIQERARKAIISTLEVRLGIHDFGSLIETELINTPHDWMSKFNLYCGSILGVSHTIPQVMWFRPSQRHANFSNLFFVGASTHPGTGVPVVLYGAKLVADLIKNDFKHHDSFIRGTGEANKPVWKANSVRQYVAIDKIHRSISSNLGWIFLSVAMAVLLIFANQMLSTEPSMFESEEVSW